MDNRKPEFFLKIGIMKSLHSEGLITKSQMEQAIKLLHHAEGKAIDTESSCITTDETSH